MQAIAKVARSEIRSFFTGKRTAIDGENHRQGGLVNQQRLQRHGVRQICNAFPDVDALDARNGHQIARRDGFGFIPFQASEGIQLGDARGGQLAVQLDDAHVCAAPERAVENAPDRDASQEFAVIQVHHLNLQHALWIARRSRNVFHDGLE